MTVMLWETVRLNDWPGGLHRFIDLMTEKLEAIPTEFRGGARIRFEADGDRVYMIEIQWQRPETQADRDEAEAYKKRCFEALKKRELQKLAELKAKYEQ